MQGGRDDFVPANGSDERVDGIGGDPGHVQKVADQSVQPVGAFVDRGEQFLVLLGGVMDAGLSEGSDGEFDASTSGVRRSWETARRMEVRMVLLSASRRTSRRLAASCWRSSWAARCTPNAPSSRRSLAGRVRPVRMSQVVGVTCSMFSAASGAAGGAMPTFATSCQPRPPAVPVPVSPADV